MIKNFEIYMKQSEDMIMSSNDLIKEVFKFENDDDAVQFEAETIHLDLINEISKLMSLKNMNKAELAKALGTTKGYVSQLFSGEKLLNLKTLAKIQRIFGVKLNLQFVLKCEIKKDERIKDAKPEKFKKKMPEFPSSMKIPKVINTFHN